MDISNLSQASSVETNCYESIAGENTSLYYSFNETLKDRRDSELDEININEDFIKSNPGTVIKRDFEKSPVRGGVVNKNILQLKIFPHTSTPTQSPKVKITKLLQQQLQSGNISLNTAANLSGVTPLLEQQNNLDSSYGMNSEKFEKNLHSNSFQASSVVSVTSSLREFERFEEMIADQQEQQQQRQREDIFAEMARELKLSTENRFDIGKFVDFNLVKIDEENEEAHITSTQAEMKTEKKDGRNTPIIVVVPPAEECEEILEIQAKKQDYEKIISREMRKSVNAQGNDDQIFVLDDLSENKENVNILFNNLNNCKREMDLNNMPEIILANNSHKISKNIVSKIDNKLQDKKESVDEKTSALKKSSKTAEESIISLVSLSNSSSALKTIIENHMQDPNISEKSFENMKDESSAKDSDDNNKIDITKKKIRRSVRIGPSKDSRKSLIEETTDSSSDPTPYANKNEKFQKLNSNSRKSLRRPSSMQFVRPREYVLCNNPDLLTNVLSKDTYDKRRSIKPQKPVTNLPKIIKPAQDKEPIKKSEKQPTMKMENLKMQVRSTGQEKIVDGATFGIPAAKKRMSIVKAVKAKDSPKLLKSKPRLSNIVKTTLNSPSMFRRSIAAKSVRKTRIPTAEFKKPTSATTKMSTAKSTASLAGEISKFPATLFTCRICSMSFKLKSTFETHKKTHETSNKCEYCDKTFAFAKALDNHLLENCSRIPPLVKKKLIQTAVNKKTQEQQRGGLRSNSSNDASGASGIPNRSDAEQAIAAIQEETNNCSDKKMLSKKTEKLPYSGIYRTPSKPLACYKCKKSFLNVYAFTEHSASHSSDSQSSENAENN